jgi:hypothetical protein
MTDRSVTDEHVHEARSAEGYPPSGAVMRSRGRKETIQGGADAGETTGGAGSEWQDHLPMERGGKSAFRWVGDLILLITGIGTAMANLLAAGFGMGVWLKQWHRWSPAVVTGLMAAGGLSILGWGLFRD